MEEEVPTGDFNTPEINWSTLSANPQFSCDLIFQHDYTQLVEYSTHIHGNILDLMIAMTKNIASLQIHIDDNLLLKSDHYPVTFNLDMAHNCTENDPTFTYLTTQGRF